MKWSPPESTVEQGGVPAVALHEACNGDGSRTIRTGPVLGKVVDPDHLVLPSQQLLYYIAADEAGRAAHEYRRHYSLISVLVHHFAEAPPP